MLRPSPSPCLPVTNESKMIGQRRIHPASGIAHFKVDKLRIEGSERDPAFTGLGQCIHRIARQIEDDLFQQDALAMHTGQTFSQLQNDFNLLRPRLVTQQLRHIDGGLTQVDRGKLEFLLARNGAPAAQSHWHDWSGY